MAARAQDGRRHTTPGLTNKLNIHRHASIFSVFAPEPHWSKAFSDAEKIVGFPTSFLNLRYLVSDEFSNIVGNVRKLVGTNHPLLWTAKRFLYDETHTLQTRGLLVLLLSKAAGPVDSESQLTESPVSGISSSQRILAEIAEMIHTAYEVHQSVVNMESWKPEDGPIKDIEFGNKMAVLSGDYLLAVASTSLAKLNNTTVVDVIASALQDLMCAEFCALKSISSASTPQLLEENQLDMQLWEKQVFLASGSLLAKSCQCAIMLAGHSQDMQTQAYDFGKNMAFSYQIRKDLDALQGKRNKTLTITSVPAILYILSHPADHEFKQLLSDTSINHDQIKSKLTSAGVVAEVQEQCKKYGQNALSSLENFTASESKTALQNIIKAIIR